MTESNEMNELDAKIWKRPKYPDVPEKYLPGDIVTAQVLMVVTRVSDYGTAVLTNYPVKDDHFVSVKELTPIQLVERAPKPPFTVGEVIETRERADQAPDRSVFVPVNDSYSTYVSDKNIRTGEVVYYAANGSPRPLPRPTLPAKLVHIGGEETTHD